MSRKAPPIDLQQKLIKLRAQLQKANISNANTSNSPMNYGGLISTYIEPTLPVVLSDALNGVDIIHRYPDFFQHLLTDKNLRQDFLDDLDILERSLMGTLESLPETASRDLHFLQSVPPTQTVELSATGNWRITWIQMAQHLEQIFLSPTLSSEAAYRSGSSQLEEIPFRLFQSTVELDGQSIAARLEALQPLNNPETLQLSLRITREGGSQTTAQKLPIILAHLQWGQFDQTVQVAETGNAQFPEIALSTILNSSGAKIAHNLHLTLEATP